MTTKAERGRAVVLGLGLMGASLAARLRASRPGWTIAGYDVDEESCQRAVSKELVHEASTDAASMLAGADLIVLAAPVRGILEWLEKLPHVFDGEALVIDLGSTKEVIVNAMAALPKRLRGVGGHPMTGARTAGVDGASATLYEDRRFVLCWPSDEVASSTKDEARAVVDDIGARLIELDAREHDRSVAAISHLPYAMAIPLLGVLAHAGDSARELVAGGFRSRVDGAGHNPPMWGDIFATNREALLATMAAYRSEMERLEERIRSDTAEELCAFLSEVQTDAEGV